MLLSALLVALSSVDATSDTEERQLESVDTTRQFEKHDAAVSTERRG